MLSPTRSTGTAVSTVMCHSNRVYEAQSYINMYEAQSYIQNQCTCMRHRVTYKMYAMYMYEAQSYMYIHICTIDAWAFKGTTHAN